VTTRRLKNGLVWTIPVTLAVTRAQADELKGARDVALIAQGSVVAVLHLEESYQPDKPLEATHVFGTNDASHPGVKRLETIGEVYLGGRISVVNRPKATTFLPYRLDPRDTRALFAQRGWKRVVAFQTRNPIHRAHEYIQKCALEICDGMLLHPIVGETKGDDVPAAVRMKSYEVLLANYYPKDRVVLAAPVRVELLAGVRAADAPRLRRVLDALETLRPTDATWQRMEEWALHGSERGQRFGVGDLLVAAIAADWQGSLWSLDRDFERMAKLGFVSLHQPATA